MFSDPLYLIIMVAGMILGGGATLLVKTAFGHYSKVRAASGLTGAQSAQKMLDLAGVKGVRIERSTRGHLSDHYDPRDRVIRLSDAVYDRPSLAALGVACHEAGHAIQHARHYAPLVLRNAFVPVASIGSQFSFILIIVGLGLGAAQGAGLGVMVAVAGIALFGAVVLFQLINLVPEFDASSRAKRVLIDSGMITREESAGVSRVLTAAALTYVAATLIALVQLLYWVMVIFGNRRN
jgi:Zn-dependent membrane protease YugP